MGSFKDGAVIERVKTTVSNGGTLVLTSTSQQNQQITGSTSHTIQLPDATTLPVGRKFYNSNRSTTSISVHYNDASLAKSLTTDTESLFILVDNSTSNGVWDISTGTGGGGTGAGGINYITNPGFEGDTSGYVAYADAADTRPVDGTGGSPVVTITRTTSSPLRGTGSGLITKDAANRQGNGVSYDFTVDRADVIQGRKLKVSFDFETSALFVAGPNSDIQMWAYDITNAVLIPVTPQAVDPVNGTYEGEMQLDPTSTSYRLIWHVATTNSAAWTFKFDNVMVGPTDIPALSGNISARAFRTGAQSIPDTTVTKVEFNGITHDTNGAFDDVTNYRYTVPVSGFYAMYSMIYFSANGTGFRSIMLKKNGSTPFLANSGNSPSASSVDTFTVSDVRYLLAGDYIEVFVQQNSGGALNIGDDQSDGFFTIFRLPDDASNTTGPLVQAKYIETTPQSIPNATVTLVNLSIKQFDTHDAISGSVFTAPKSGTYLLTASVNVNANATGIREMVFYLNGSPLQSHDSNIGFSGTANSCNLTDTVRLKTGDTISVQFNQTSGGALNTNTAAFGGVSFSVLEMDESILSAPSASVNLSVFLGGNTSFVAGNNIIYNNKNFDTHDAYNTSTGVYTVPVSGKYRMSVISQTDTANVVTYLQINSQDAGDLCKQGGSADSSASGTTVKKLLAGDTLQFQTGTNAVFRGVSTAFNQRTTMALEKID